MRQSPLALPFVFLLSFGALGLSLAGCGGSSEAETGDPPPALDTTPPFTVATPVGGLYPSIQSVTLQSDEAATIYYTTDGSDPYPQGVTTHFGSSPLSGILVDRPLMLKFYAVDLEGNEEEVQEQDYNLDLIPPIVLLNGSPETTLGWMEESAVTFASNENGTWSAELGGTGQPGTGTSLAGGTVVANTLTTLTVDGWMLDLGQVVRMDLFAFDAAGGWGRLTLDYQSVPPTSFALPGNSGELATTPDGRFLYVLRPDDGELLKYDSSPPGTTLQLLSALAVGSNPTSLAVMPDSSRVYVTCDEKIAVFATDAVSANLNVSVPPGVTPSGIEIAPDGRWAYCVCNDGYLYALDVDTKSAGFHQLTRLEEDYEPNRTEGHLAFTPAGDLAVLLWTGANSFGVKILDTDPNNAGTSFQRIVGTPIPTVARPATLAPPSTSLDGTMAYLADALGKISRMDLTAPPYPIQTTNEQVSATSSLLSPDGDVLLLFGGGLEGIRLADPLSLTVLKTVPSGSVAGAGTGDFFVYSADGSRGYIVRDQGEATGEMMVITL